MDITSYIAPELLILVPVIYLVGIGLKKSGIKDKWIPFCLGGASVFLSVVWVLGSTAFWEWRQVLLAFFSAVTQGILVAGTAVYANQIFRQAGKKE